jgi:hypothetical protein
MDLRDEVVVPELGQRHARIQAGHARSGMNTTKKT